MHRKKTILLGVTGSIAAYKSADIVSCLNKLDYDVNVIMTKCAEKFITSLTLETLTGNKVFTDMFEEIYYRDVEHISIARRANIVVIAPATANIIGKIASGIADDMLSTVVMAIKNKPILICPAMNTVMYENPIVQNNIKKLREYGYNFLEPRESKLACGDYGKGALANVEDIISSIDLISKKLR